MLTKRCLMLWCMCKCMSQSHTVMYKFVNNQAYYSVCGMTSCWYCMLNTHAAYICENFRQQKFCTMGNRQLLIIIIYRILSHHLPIEGTICGRLWPLATLSSVFCLRSPIFGLLTVKQTVSFIPIIRPKMLAGDISEPKTRPNYVFFQRF